MEEVGCRNVEEKGEVEELDRFAEGRQRERIVPVCYIHIPCIHL